MCHCTVIEVNTVDERSQLSRYVSHWVSEQLVINICILVVPKNTSQQQELHSARLLVLLSHAHIADTLK